MNIGTALTSDIDELNIANLLRDSKELIYKTFPSEYGQLERDGAVWLQAVTGFPSAMLASMTQDPLAGYWLWMSPGGCLAAVVRANHGKRLYCFNVEWD